MEARLEFSCAKKAGSGQQAFEGEREMRSWLRGVIVFCGTLPALLSAQGKPTVFKVDLAHPGAEISSQMFGIFFEDINFSADGGLYPELVKNRSFEFSEPMTGWHEEMLHDQSGFHQSNGSLGVVGDKPLNASNPHYLHVTVAKAGSYGIFNTGFRGMGVEAGKDYRFSAYVRSQGATAIRAEVKAGDKVIGSAKLEGFTGEWKRYEATVHVAETADQAQLHLSIDGQGSVDLDMVSLFPTDTWKGRPNGLRKDLVQLLADMHPGFLRFPGGCIVEGRELAGRYQWKKTIGDLAERKTIINRWNNEMEFHQAPDYFQSFGLGFYEYFQLAEDIGARPLPILNCGMACQFNTSQTAPMSEEDNYVQDALDLIDFANAPASNPWGRLRTELGHPAPFHLEMLGVGNEQWGERYLERYKLFEAAIHAKHPEIKLVVSSGPFPDIEPALSMWKAWRELHADVVDEHYYMAPEWFLEHSDRYDKYDRKGPKVFAGEYAAQSVAMASDQNRNNWKTAIAEAAFMTGLERNGDVVSMASYAPLMAHVKAWQWKPDAIWFDNLHSFGTPNYYVQAMYGGNVGTRVVPITPSKADNYWTSASLDEAHHELIVKVINHSAESRQAVINVSGAKVGAKAKVITLASKDLEAENSLEEPRKVAPVESSQDLSSGDLPVTVAPWSFTVYRIPVQ